MHSESAPVLALLGIPTVSLVSGLVILVAIAALIVGVPHWRQTSGKVAVIADGIVLLAFAAVVLGVLITVWNGSMG